MTERLVSDQREIHEFTSVVSFHAPDKPMVISAKSTSYPPTRHLLSDQLLGKISERCLTGTSQHKPYLYESDKDHFFLSGKKLLF